MFRKLFKREEKVIAKRRTYRVRIAWSNDTPWYCNLTEKDIKKFEQNPDVLDVLIFG